MPPLLRLQCRWQRPRVRLHPLGSAAWVAFLALFFTPPAFSRAEDLGSTKEFLLQGIAQRANALKSATFSARGQKTASSLNEADALTNGEVIIHGAIDGARSRFDYSEPALVAAPANIAERLRSNEPLDREEVERLSVESVTSLTEDSIKEAALSRIETYYIRTPDKISYWCNGHPTIGLVAPSVDVGSHIRRFDVNALGLYGWNEFQKGMTLSALLEGYRANERFEVQEAGKGVFRLAFLFEAALTSNRWEIEIDTLAGFTPSRTALTEVNKKTGKTAVKQSSLISWRSVNGAWVPRTFRIQNGDPDPKAGRLVVYDLEFEFDHVNDPIDENLFSYKSFPAPELSAVIDTSAAKPVVLRLPYENTPQRRLKERDAPSLWTWTVVVANLVVVAILAAYIYSRRKRSRDTEAGVRE